MLTLTATLWASPTLAENCKEVSAQISPAVGQTVAEGALVTLNGQPSKPANADTYRWEQVSSVPAGITVAIDDATASKVTFVAPQVGPSGAVLTFKLSVTACGLDASATTTVTIQNTNSPPTAVATAPATVNSGATFTLDGSASSDPDGDALTYGWALVVGGVAQPVGTTAVASVVAPDVAYPDSRTFTYRLTVSDAGGLSSASEVQVTVKGVNDPPTAIASCPTTVNERDAIILDGLGSLDGDGGIVRYSWTQLTGGPNSGIADAAAPLLTFDAPALGSRFTANGTPLTGFDTMTFQLQVTDDGGLQSSTQCSAQVLDVTPPVFSGNRDITAEATSAAGAPVSFDVQASDAVDGSVDVDCSPRAGGTFPLGTTAVTCSATDTSHNIATVTFDVTVRDTTPPVIASHGDVTAEATGPTGAVVTYAAPATSDVVDGPGTAACVPASGTLFPLGATTVSCNATDQAGNVAAPTSFKVTVKDTTPPTIAGHEDVVAEATGPGGAQVSYASPSTTDLVDGAGVATCSPGPGATFALGSTTVTCNARDRAGNAATSTSFAIVVKDTTPPVIAPHGDVTAEATGPSGAPVSYASPGTSDLVDGAGTATCAPGSGSTFALGSTRVTCSATDKAGNAAIPTSFTVVVKDTTPPAITVPASITTGPTGARGATVAYGAATASDLVDGATTPTCSPASGSLFKFGTTTVTCTASDRSGNEGSNTFQVTVTGFTFLGFYQPVDNLPAVNAVKNGATVPIKWSLTGQNGMRISDVAAVADAQAYPVSCSAFSTVLESPIELTTTGGTVLRYDLTAMQFVLNWQTPKLAGSCWRIDLTFTDGSIKSADFKLK